MNKRLGLNEFETSNHLTLIKGINSFIHVYIVVLFLESSFSLKHVHVDLAL